MSVKSILAFFSLVLALAGCATVPPVVKPLDQADSTAAYVYGNFLNIGRGAAGIALEIRNLATSETQLLKFRKDGRLVVSKLVPGRYVLDRTVGLGIGNQINGTRRLPGATSGVEFEVVAGRAYYLGDYRGTTGVAFAAGPGIGMVPDWNITGVADTFARTSQLLATQYPELRALPTERAFKPQ